MPSSRAPATSRGVRNTTTSSPGVEPRLCPRWFWPALVGICVIGAGIRFLIRAEYLAGNPFAVSPAVDALTYWNWAGRIATGQWSQDVPFFSAPLYPYLLGLIRTCGGGLPTVYTIQILLDVVTAGLLAWIARLRFGGAVGLLAAVIFLLMLEPASFCLRVLSSTLHLPLICLAWLALLAAHKRSSLPRGILAGAALGLLALALPWAIVCLPVFGFWWWWNTGRNLPSLGRAAIASAVGLVVISPATIHNYRACGELIPISAQAGVTFAHGNGPGAQGTYTPTPGVSVYREAQNVDTFRIYREATGQTATWRAVSTYFFQRGLDYWRSDPAETAWLLARKAYWFLTGRNYGDIYQPTMEIAEGLSTRLRLTPLHSAWLVPVALVALVVWLRRFNDHVPELMLFGVPLLIVIVFWFSPRYRLPAVPVIVVATAWALSRAVDWRRRKNWTIAVTAALALGVGLGFVNRVAGFDTLEPYRPKFHNALGTAWSSAGQLEEAVKNYRMALELQPGYAEAASNLGSVLTRLGRSGEVLLQLQRAVQANPSDAFAHDSLARALIAANRPAEALAHFQKAVELNPRAPELRNNLGNALRIRGDLDAAQEQYQAALELDPTYAEAHLNLGNVLTDQGQHDPALRHFREALRLESALVAAHMQIAHILLTRGDAPGCVASLRSAQKLAPQDRTIANELAWFLATVPDLGTADRAEALRLARRATTGPDLLTPGKLDTLAAALAANGQYAEAARVGERAIALAEQRGATELAAQFRRRVELYRAGKPYVEPIKPTPR